MRDVRPRSLALVTLAPVVASAVNAPPGPAVERCNSNPVSFVELSRHVTSIWLLDAATALVPDGALTVDPGGLAAAASIRGVNGVGRSQPTSSATSTSEPGMWKRANVIKTSLTRA